MRFAEVAKILGGYLYYFSIVLCFPLSVALYYQFVATPQTHPQPHCSKAFFLSFCCAVLLTAFFSYLGRSSKGILFRREAIFSVVSIWLISSLIAACPFYFSHTLTNPLDAYFEATAALTTTGSTMISPKVFDDQGNEIKAVIKLGAGKNNYSYYGTVAGFISPIDHKHYEGLEAVPRTILLWRSFLEWLGGLGIVVLFLTVFPVLGVGGKQLYSTEITGPVGQEVSPRLKETASSLWKLYIFLTFSEVALLIYVEPSMPFLEALCTGFSNLSTGGFSVHNEGIMRYHNSSVEWIVMLFMILGSINFSLYFYLIRLKLYKIYQSDFFLFLAFVVLGSLTTTYLIYHTPNVQTDVSYGYYDFWSALRSGSFQWISAQSCTGYLTAEFDRWPVAAQMMIFFATFIGGMAGSTSGGLKTLRYYLFYQVTRNQMQQLVRPETVRKIYLSDRLVPQQVATTILLFFCIAALSFIVALFCFVLDGIDTKTAAGLSTSFLNNVGLGARVSTSTKYINFLSPLSKLLSIFWMFLGRLEYFAIGALFLPSFWKQN